MSPRSNLSNPKSLTPRELPSHWDEPGGSCDPGDDDFADFLPMIKQSTDNELAQPQSPISTRLSMATPSPHHNHAGADIRKRKLTPSLAPSSHPRSSLNPSDAKKPLLERALSPDSHGPIKSQIPRRVMSTSPYSTSSTTTTPKASTWHDEHRSLLSTIRSSICIPDNSRSKRSFSPAEAAAAVNSRESLRPKSSAKKTKVTPSIDSWINQYQSWSAQDQKIALKKLIDLAAPNNVRYMREGTRFIIYSLSGIFTIPFHSYLWKRAKDAELPAGFDYP